MNKLPYFITGGAVILAALFAILNRFWTGFVYFVLASLLVLSLFWGVWLIYKYFTDFKEELKDRFVLYKANKVNTTNTTTDMITANKAAYEKQFNKSVLKDKIIKWFIILFCFSVAAMFLIGMILY